MQNSKQETNKNSYMLPISIILAGIIISLALILSSHNKTPNTQNTNNKNQYSTKNSPSSTTQGSNTVTVSIGTNPIEGNINKAKVGIIEFGDFQCPFCKQFYNSTQSEIISKYVNTGEAIFAFRDYPLESVHPLAMNMAIEGRCFGEQGKFWQFDSTMYTTNQDTNTPSVVLGYAKDLGLNINKYQSCVASDQYQTQIQNDINAGNTMGIQGTPTIVIGKLVNGKVVGKATLGAYSFSYFEPIINSYL